MQRRQAIRDMALVAGGILTLPAWARAWSPATLPDRTFFTLTTYRDLLSTVIGAILPESEIPGAVSLGVPTFVELMLADCYPKEDSDNVQTGLRFAESVAQRRYQKAFSELPLAEQQGILTEFEKGDDKPLKDFYGLVKNLTLQGYSTSEYVQTTFLEYEMAPGFYRCVPVKQ